LTNRSKQKGTAFESLIRDYLKQEWSDDIERLPLSGEKDRGDIANFRVGSGRRLVALELKNRSQLSLSQWVTEAQEEAKNYDAVAGVAIFKRKGKGQAGDQFVVATLSDFLTILHAAAS
jgi:hypothetical protein